MSLIVLEIGVNDSWSYAFFRKLFELIKEVKEWEEVKCVCNGLYFFVI